LINAWRKKTIRP